MLFLNKIPHVFRPHELDKQIAKMPLVGFCEIRAANKILSIGINRSEG